MRLAVTTLLLALSNAVREKNSENTKKHSVLNMEYDEIPDKSKAEGVDVKFDVAQALDDYEEDIEGISKHGYNINSFKDEETGAFQIGGVSQWVLFDQDLIEEGDVHPGWSNNSTTTCYGAGITMVGPFAAHEVSRTFTGLPPHAEVRVKATFHFVDGWLGEAAFMKASVGPSETLAYVWSDQHAQDRFTGGYDLCGRVEVPEGKFSVPIDVVLPHNNDDLKLAFGSTMDINNPDAAFWGVSAVEVYIH